MMTAVMGAMVLAQFVPGSSLIRSRATAAPRPQVEQVGDAEVLGAIGARDANLIEASTMASTKASSGEVKTIAQQLLDAHQRSLTRGADLAKQLNLSRELPPDSAMARMQESTMDQLALLNGAAFDRAFVQYVADAHAAEIQKATSTQAPAAEHPLVKAFVTARLPELQAHHATATTWLGANPP